MTYEPASGTNSVTDSEFYMWRSLFALVHVDYRVSDEEVRFMAEALEDVPFSDEQRSVLEGDIKTPQDVVEMFGRISNPRDQAKFFNFAREIVWADGDYGSEEQEIMLKLKEIHMKNTVVDDLVGFVDLELEDDSPVKSRKEAPRKRSFSDVIAAFTGRVRH